MYKYPTQISGHMEYKTENVLETYLAVNFAEVIKSFPYLLSKYPALLLIS